MRLLLSAFLIFLTWIARAEDEANNAFSIGADLVSTYVWRGSYQAGTSFQPTMGYSLGGFSVDVWGSVDIAGFGYKEVDFSASYTHKNFTAGLSDYWVGGEMSYHYFDYSKTTIHLLEASLLYRCERIPLSVGWYAIVAGDEWYTKYEKKGKTKKAFPAYLETSYTFYLKDVSLETSVGVSPWQSSRFYNRYEEGGQTDGFAVINLSLKACKEIRITDRYCLPVFGQLILNPAKEDVFLVFGIKF